MANIEQQKPVTSDTLFIWASVSKTVTTTALMQLYEQGKFKLDDPIDQTLGFTVTVPSCPTARVTFRQLLTHTSSIQDDDRILNALETTEGDSPVALADFVKGYLMPGGAYYDPDRNFESGCPGTVYDYSNMGVTTMGYLVQLLSGIEFSAYARQNVFQPLEMEKSSFTLAGLKDTTNVATPYDRKKAGTLLPLGNYGEADFPDGMMRTSPTQLAHFLMMYAQGGNYGGHQLLQASTIQEILKPQTSLDDDDLAQGLIWYKDNYGPDVWGHNGNDDGAASNMYFDPATGAGVVMVANADWNTGADSDNDHSVNLLRALFQEAESY
jgi:CubicO group peptidase (beta-lactamase class C family)